MQRQSTRLLRSALILMSLGLVCIWGLSDDSEQQAAQAAYQRADCQSAIPKLQSLTQQSMQPAPSTAADLSPTTGAKPLSLTENQYRLAECQRYQSAQQAQQSQQFNRAFSQYVRFVKVYPHSALVSSVRTQLQRIADRTSPGRLASPETCQGITLLLDRGVLSGEQAAIPHLLLTCGRLWNQQQEFDRAIHAYAALEIRYPNHYLVQMFAPEFQQLLQRSALNRSSVTNLYQAVEQRELNRLNQLAQPEPYTDWLTDLLWPIAALDRWLGNALGVYLFLAGLSLLLGWLFAQSFGVKYFQSIRSRFAPRTTGDRPWATTTAQPCGINLTNGQYRLGKRSLDHLHSGQPTQQPGAESPPTAQTTQHLTSTNPASLHPKPNQYRFDRLALKRQQRSQKAGQAKRQPPANSNQQPKNNKQPPHLPRRRPAAAPRRRPSQSLERQLLLMVQQNRPTAERLVELERSRVPDQSEDWYWQAAIDRLLRDRR
ncbi:MAG: hypothetical protein EA001_09190 [Oscillatoriales cyanobacterium]|nr:MAG: hypothetical protein EA001_09190 [Oscillatoriales cyanobacterium]